MRGRPVRGDSGRDTGGRAPVARTSVAAATADTGRDPIAGHASETAVSLLDPVPAAGLLPLGRPPRCTMRADGEPACVDAGPHGAASAQGG